MKFIDTELTGDVRWLGMFVLGLAMIISLTMVFYYNVLDNTYFSLGVSLMITSLVMYFIIQRIEKIET